MTVSKVDPNAPVVELLADSERHIPHAFVLAEERLPVTDHFESQEHWCGTHNRQFSMEA